MKLLDAIVGCAASMVLPAVVPATAGLTAASDDVTIGPPLPPGANEGVWIENRGQWPDGIRFLGQVPGRIVRLECGAIGLQTYDGEQRYVRIVFEDASPFSTPSGEDPVQGHFSFFLTLDASKWRPCVPGYRRVRSPEFLPGLDLVCDLNSDGLHVRLLTSQGQEPIDPEVRVEGAPTASITRLPLSSALATFARSSASVTQSVQPTGAARGSSSGQSLSAPGPGLRWATYLGSSDPQDPGSQANRCAWNDVGELVVTGATRPIGFPLTPGAYHGPTISGYPNGYVAKFRGRDGALIYSCLLGVAGLAEVVLDHDGSATLIGGTQSPTYPTTPGAFQPTMDYPGTNQGIITRLTPSADALVFSTYLNVQGPRCNLKGIQLHPSGGVVIAGWAEAYSQVPGPSFPTTPGAFQTAFTGSRRNAFVGWLDASGSFFHWLTLFGGTYGYGPPYPLRETELSGLVMTPAGEPIILGRTGCNDLPTMPGVFQPTLGMAAIWVPYVARLNTTGSGLVWCTYLAGTTAGEEDQTGNVTIDAFENVFVSGITTVPTFPVTPGAFQTHFPHSNTGSTIYNGFIAKLDPTAHTLLYSTLVTGRQGGGAGSINSDSSGVLTFGCYAFDQHWYWSPGSYNSGQFIDPDIGLMRLSPAGDRPFYATHVGGPYSDFGLIRAGSSGQVAMVGYSNGGFPTTPGAVQPSFSMGQTNSIVAVFDPYLLGVQSLGASTPSCLGEIQMNTTEMPAAGSQTFALWCSGAPPYAAGRLLMGAPRDTALSLGGAQIWVDLTQPYASQLVSSDGVGFLETALPLPASSSGRSVVAQYVFRNTPTCTTGARACASNALTITVQ